VKVLVTGGAGFKGCVVVETLLAEGHDVTVFDIFRYGEAAAICLIRAGARVVRGDVTRVDQLSSEVPRHDAVVHLAALVGFPACDSEPVRADDTNIGGTRNVISCLRSDQLLVYASTGSVYGRVQGLCTEDTPTAPLTRYGCTKLSGERLAVAFGGVGLRFATVFGVSPCMRFDLMPNAFVYRAIHIGWMTLYQPNDRRSFVHVNDAASSYGFALQNYDRMAGHVFNVGDASLNLTKQEVADAVCEQFPMRVINADVETDPDQRNYDVSFAKINRLGFRAATAFDASLAAVGAAARVATSERWRFTA